MPTRRAGQHEPTGQRWPAVRRLPSNGCHRLSVASRTGPDRYEVLIDDQTPEGYDCTCPRFTVNTHHHGRPCHHIRAALIFLLCPVENTR